MFALAHQNQFNEVSTLIKMVPSIIEAQDSFGHTILVIAAATGNIRTLKQVLQACAADGRVLNGSEALIVSVSTGFFGSVELLLTSTVINKNALSLALIDAVQTGNKKLIQRLLASDPDVNYRDNKGLTSLMYSILCTESSIIEILLAAQANIHIRNYYGQNSLDIAQQIHGTGSPVFKLLQRALQKQSFAFEHK
jgi:ankyrin repeat protein